MESVIELRNVTKNHKTKNKQIEVLKDVNVRFDAGKFYALMGHSGSGKTTVTNVIGMLDTPTSGVVLINNLDTSKVNKNEEADFRRDYIGFIFQDFYLDEHLKAYENVMLPMLINNNIKKSERYNKALELLALVDLNDRIEHYPHELSGGEQQRVAIARALANNPKIIIADEPTGNLDEENEELIFKILKQLSNDGKCIIVVSHSNEVLRYADVVYKLQNGILEVRQ